MPKDRDSWFSELLVNVIDVSFLVINFDFALNAFKVVAELSLVEHFHQLKAEILAFETIFTGEVLSLKHNLLTVMPKPDVDLIVDCYLHNVGDSVRVEQLFRLDASNFQVLALLLLWFRFRKFRNELVKITRHLDILLGLFTIFPHRSIQT